MAVGGEEMEALVNSDLFTPLAPAKRPSFRPSASMKITDRRCRNCVYSGVARDYVLCRPRRAREARRGVWTGVTLR